MKPNAVSISEEYLLSSSKLSMSFLKYQLVFSFKDGAKYLRSFNIIRNGKIVRKIYLEKMLPLSMCQNIEDILVENLIKLINNNQYSSRNKGNATNRKKKQTKPNENARYKAASDLFSDLGL